MTDKNRTQPEPKMLQSIINKISLSHFNANETLVCIAERLKIKNPIVRKYALDLLDQTVNAGPIHYARAVAAKEFMSVLSAILDEPGLSVQYFQRIVWLLHNWSLKYKAEGFFEETYNSLKAKGFVLPSTSTPLEEVKDTLATYENSLIADDQYKATRDEWKKILGIVREVNKDIDLIDPAKSYEVEMSVLTQKIEELNLYHQKVTEFTPSVDCDNMLTLGLYLKNDIEQTTNRFKSLKNKNQVPPFNSGFDKKISSRILLSERSLSKSVSLDKTEEKSPPKTPDSDVQQCKICYSGISAIVFAPCGHKGCCIACGEKMMLCPFCNTPITTKIKVFDVI